MNAELVVAEYLTDSTITALVSTRVACSELPQNTTYPAVVYDIISYVPDPHININENQLVDVRVQITVLAETIGEIKTVHEAIRNVMGFSHQTTVATKSIVHCRLDSAQAIYHDNDFGLWEQSADYRLTYYE